MVAIVARSAIGDTSPTPKTRSTVTNVKETGKWGLRDGSDGAEGHVMETDSGADRLIPGPGDRADRDQGG